MQSSLFPNGFWLAAMFATHIAFMLHGPGLRRPFGSVETVRHLPLWVRRARLAVTIVDCAMVLFLIWMWVQLFGQSGKWWVFVFWAVVLTYAGDALANKITLIPSFFVTMTLVMCALLLAPHIGIPPVQFAVAH